MGFFDEEDVKSEFTTNCSDCGLFFKCNSPKIQEYGTGSNGILVLLGVPSFEQDTHGTYKSGSFYYLKSQLNEIGINIDECVITSCLNCYTEHATGIQYDCCKAHVNSVIEKYNPKLVIALGGQTLPATVGVDFSRNIDGIEKWRGFTIPMRRWNAWVVHTYSPEEMVLNENFERNDNWKSATTFEDKVLAIQNYGSYRIMNRIFKEDIRNAYIKSRNDIPEDPATKTIVSTILNSSDAIVWIEKAIAYISENKDTELVVDIETSALKCYNNDQFIYSIALMYDEAVGSVAFKTDDSIVIRALRRLFLLTPKIIGANWKFDRNWILKKFGVPTDNLVWDTVIMAHILDQRDSVTSLKFCTYCYFGISYEDTVHEYLSANGSNQTNRIKDAPIEDLLYYNALDVAYTWFVKKEQVKEFELLSNPNKTFAKDLFLKGSIALAKMEYNGMRIDLNKAQESKNICEKHLLDIQCAIENEAVWREWKQLYGDKASLVSEAQIIEIFIRRKGLWPEGISRNRDPRADKDFISKMVAQEPFLNYVLEKRKWEKIKETYLANYFKEANDDGKIRCFYGLNNVHSYRMSASSPNLQNQSSRNAEQVELLKSCFIPEEDSVIMSSDFRALENYISASITGDEYMLGALNEIDMHKDNALSAFICTEEQFSELAKYSEKAAKTLRNLGKSFSFACLYGATENKVAETLWEGAIAMKAIVSENVSAIDHLIVALDMESKYKKYLRSEQEEPKLCKDEFYFEVFKAHIKKCLDKFWLERMKVTNDWRNNTWNSYIQTGIIDYPTGLQIRGNMSRNSALNSPPQGSGSCVTLWCVCRLTYLIEKLNLKTKLCGVIHDSIMANVPKSEVVTFAKLMKQVMEDETKNIFPWLRLNLQIETELYTESWAVSSKYEEKDWIGY